MKIEQEKLALLKAAFAQQECVKLESFLELKLLAFLASAPAGKFKKLAILGENSTEFTLDDFALSLKLNVLFSSSEFLGTLSGILGVDVKHSRQRLYYNDPTCLALPWHDDSYDQDGRIAALRFELSEDSYEGGDFYFKNERGEKRFSKLQFGESVLFKIEHKRCFHRVDPVTRGIRKSLIIFLD